MKIAFLHDWTFPINEIFDNEDGLPRAIQVLAERGHKIDWYCGSSNGSDLTLPFRGCKLNLVSNMLQLESMIISNIPDIFICWGSLDRPWFELIHRLYPSIPKILCFAGGSCNHNARNYFKVIVCESEVYINEFMKLGSNAMRGFGTNTKIFKYLGLHKLINAIYPASFCFHKNIELFARSFGGSGLCVGNHNEPTIVSKILKLGAHPIPRVSSFTLASLYNLSRVTVLTGGKDSGSQRIVLESMACGTPVIVMNDNDRCVEFVEESKFGKVCHPIDEDIRQATAELIDSPPPIELGINYINSKWSEYLYADSLEKAIGVSCV